MAPQWVCPSTSRSRVCRCSQAYTCTGQLDGPHDVSGHADDKQLAQPGHEDVLGHHPGVGARNHAGEGALPVLEQIGDALLGQVALVVERLHVDAVALHKPPQRRIRRHMGIPVVIVGGVVSASQRRSFVFAHAISHLAVPLFSMALF